MSTLALPSPREELWRWSDMAALQAARSPSEDKTPVPPPILTDAARIVFVDGALDSATLDLAPVTLASDHPLARHISGTGHSLTLAPRTVTTLEIARHSNGDAQTPLVITLGEDAVLTLVETYTGTGWSNALSRFDLGKGARVMRAVRVKQGSGYVSTRDEVIGCRSRQGASYVATFLGAGDMRGRASTPQITI